MVRLALAHIRSGKLRLCACTDAPQSAGQPFLTQVCGPLNPADYNIRVWFLNVVYLVRLGARAELPEQCCPLGLVGLEKASGRVA